MMITVFVPEIFPKLRTIEFGKKRTAKRRNGLLLMFKGAGFGWLHKSFMGACRSPESRGVCHLAHSQPSGLLPGVQPHGGPLLEAGVEPEVGEEGGGLESGRTPDRLLTPRPQAQLLAPGGDRRGVGLLAEVRRAVREPNDTTINYHNYVVLSFLRQTSILLLT